MTSGFRVGRGRRALTRRLLPLVLVALVACSTGAERDVAEPDPTTDGRSDASEPTDPDPGEDPSEPVWQPLLEPGVGGRVTDVSFDPADADRLLVSGDGMGIVVSGDDGATWRRAAGLTGGEIASLTWHPTHPGEVWAATRSGPQVSYDAGETWALRRDGLRPPGDDPSSAPVGRILVDPHDEDRLLAFGEELQPGSAEDEPGPGSIWHSVDGGSSWIPLADLGPGRAVTDATFLVDGRTVLAATGGGVFRSPDGGRTWEPSSDGLPHLAATSVAAHPTRDGRAWVALDAADDGIGGILRSDDGGRTWTATEDRLAILNGPTAAETSRFADIAVAPSDPDVLYTSDLADGRRAVYRSDDGGLTWHRLPAPVDGFYRTEFSALVLAVAPDDPDRVIAGQEESLFASHDGGQVWQDIGAVAEGEGHRGIGISGLSATAIGFADDGTLAVQARDGAPLLVRRPDGSWQSPLQDWDPWGGGYDLSIVGESWWALLGQDGTFNGIARSTDNGLTWEVLAGGDLPPAGQELADAPHSILALSEATALATFGGALHRTDDGGASWQVVTGAVQAALARSPVDAHVVVGSGPGGVHRSRDGGRSFEPLGGPGRAGDLVVDGDGSVYATVLGTVDAGVWRRVGSWRQILDHPLARATAVDPRDGEHLLVATGDEPAGDEPAGDQPLADGVLESVDGGATWSPLTEGLGAGRVSTVAFDPTGSGQVVAGTLGGGFYRLDR